jgi:hypothetical protein
MLAIAAVFTSHRLDAIPELALPSLGDEPADRGGRCRLVDQHPVPGLHLTHVRDRAQGGPPALGTAAACSKLNRPGLGTTLTAASVARSSCTAS